MNFVTLSGLQVMLVAGATIAAILILFFLKLRHRRVVVGSALLWNRVIDEQHANSLLEKLRRLASLLLTLIIALLLAISLGRPQIGTADAGSQSVVVVLDASASMGTRTSEGNTRWTQAIEEASTIIRTVPGAGPYLVADTAGRVRTAFTPDRDTALVALEEMTPFPGRQRFPTLPSGEAQVYFVTDGVSRVEVPDGVVEISVFESATNVAITAFQVRVDPTSPAGYRAFLEVTNYSPSPSTVGVLLSGTADRREAWRLDLAAGEVWQEEIDLSGFRGGGLRLRIEAEGDALELDDTAYAYLPGTASIRVDLVTTAGDGYLAKLLGLSPRVDLQIIAPSEFEDTPAVDVYIFDRYAPATAPDTPSLVFGSPDVEWLPRLRGSATDQSIVTWAQDHPLMLHVPVYDLVIRDTPVVEAGDWTVIAEGDETPLILAEDGRVRRAFVAFSPEDSDFAFHLGFPIFVENALGWASGEEPSEEAGLGYVAIPIDAEAVTTLDGGTVPITERFGTTVIEAPEPELFTATFGGRRFRVAVNLFDRVSSNVNDTRLPEGSTAGITNRAAEPWIYMLVVASILIAIEWWTYHRRITL